MFPTAGPLDPCLRRRTRNDVQQQMYNSASSSLQQFATVCSGFMRGLSGGLPPPWTPRNVP
eukprot:7981671-Alexandrium_andersonii.AAC.1